MLCRGQAQRQYRELHLREAGNAIKQQQQPRRCRAERWAASLQVMAALREGRTSTSGTASGGSTPMAATPRGATPRANGRGGYAVAESVQQALLYVRFRTAADTGLKGRPPFHHTLHRTSSSNPPASHSLGAMAPTSLPLMQLTPRPSPRRLHILL